MTFSLQLYTVRRELEADLPGTLKQLAAIGFREVEPYNFHANAEELAAALKDNNLSAPSGHAPLLRSDQDAIFAAARLLGIGTVIDPHVAAEQWTAEEDIAATAAALNAAAEKGAPLGVRGQDPVELLERLGDRVRFIHIKDGPATSNPADQVAVGSGTLPIWDIVGAAHAVESGVMELDDFAGNMMDAVAASFEYLSAGRPS